MYRVDYVIMCITSINLSVSESSFGKLTQQPFNKIDRFHPIYAKRY